MAYRRDLPDEVIIRRYTEDEMHIKALAREYNCSGGAIVFRLRRAGVPIRGCKEVGQINGAKRVGIYNVTLPVSEIVRKYVEDGMGANEIAQECGCDEGTVRLRLRRVGVEIRGGAEAARMPRRLAKYREKVTGQERPQIRGEKNAFYGKTHTEEVRVKIREARARQVFSRESIEKRAESHRRHWASLSEEEKLGRKKHLFGRRMSDENRRKLREANLRDISRQEVEVYYYGLHWDMERVAEILGCTRGTLRLRMREWGLVIRHRHLGRRLTEDAKQKISQANKGRPRTAEWLEKLRVASTGRRLSEEAKVKCRIARENQTFSQESIEKRGQSMSRNWQNMSAEEKNERIRQWIVAANRRPNKFETRIHELLEAMFPGEWAYVGDGSLLIDGLNPDLVNVNGKKQIIECFGDYWHGEKKATKHTKTEEGRIEAFARFGYQTLVIWEHECDDIDKLQEKIFAFVGVS